MKHTNQTNAPDRSRSSFQAAACWFIAIAVLAVFLLTVMLIPRSSASTSDNSGSDGSPSTNGSPSVPDAGVTLPPSASAYTTELSNFLNEDQIWLLQAAEDFYLMTFGGDTSMINTWTPAGEDMPPPEKETIEQNGMIYKAGYGRWAKWEDFDCYVHTLFTDQCWKKRNECGGFPTYIGYNGRMYYINAAMGGTYYNYNFPDQFRLEEQTKDSITFTIIGHYSNYYPLEGETFEERDHRVETSFDCTLEFPIQMVLTEDGWRINQFASPRSAPDEDAAIIAAGLIDLF